MATEVNPIDLFVQAGPVVRAVAVILAVLSLWSWAIIANAILGLARLKKAGRALSQAAAAPDAAGVRDAALSEAAITYDEEELSDRRQRVQGAMRRRAQQFTEQCQGNLGNLAVIASVAPFVGLFGTVWGIMTSFVGIAAAKDTSLEVVAPGIAEALAATALGLAAAIPAAFAYNRLATAFGKASRALARQVDARAPEVSSTQMPQAAHSLTRVA